MKTIATPTQAADATRLADGRTLTAHGVRISGRHMGACVGNDEGVRISGRSGVRISSRHTGCRAIASLSDGVRISGHGVRISGGVRISRGVRISGRQQGVRIS